MKYFWKIAPSSVYTCSMIYVAYYETKEDFELKNQKDFEYKKNLKEVYDWILEVEEY